MANSHFCSQPCTDDAEKKGPMILEVPFGHVTFKSGQSLFFAFVQSEFLTSCFFFDNVQWRNNSRPRGDTDLHVRLSVACTRL